MVDEYVELGPVKLAGTWQVARGQWTISEDEQEFTCNGYLVDEDTNKDALCLSSVRMTDGVLAAEIMVEEVVPDVTNAHLVFRYLDNELYSLAGLGGWHFKFVIGQRTLEESGLRRGGWAPVASDAGVYDIIPGRWYDLRVDFARHDIKLYLGDACVLSYISPQRHPYYAIGNIGFRAWDKCRTHFRNPRAFQRVRKADLGSRLQRVDLSFIANAALHAVANRDLEEVTRLDADVAPKAVVLLLGSIAEAALLDTLQKHETDAKNCPSARKSPIRRWNLATMIDVARELNAIGEQTCATSHVLRGYRNLVHPAKPEAQKLAPWTSQAIAATDFVLALLDDLRRFA